MGLDITAYSRLTAMGKHTKDPELNEGEPGGLDDWCYYENHVQAYAYKTFPQSFLGVPVLDEGDGMVFGGCYAITEATQTIGFCAGSYSGYNHWRSALQEKYNPNRREDEPFYELIWFADNEGSIGPMAAQELLRDFDAHPDLDMGQLYSDFRRACELAAQDGLISFH